MATKQKEILYQGNECQNMFTSFSHTRQNNGNIVLDCESTGRITNTSAKEIKTYRYTVKQIHTYNIPKWEVGHIAHYQFIDNKPISHIHLLVKYV